MNAFELNNLTKVFPDFTLGPLNLTLEPGTVLGYIGPNGAGKSTTMHCMMGLLRPDSGTVNIFGKPNDLNKPEWKLNVGYVGDENPFYESWSCAKNLKFLRHYYPAWSDDLVANLAHRFELKLDQKVKTLSTGNRIKLACICALAHQPKLLLLDEPTSGLDPVVRTELLDVIFEILESGERAIFYSTHILSDISRLADDLVFLNEGHIHLRTAKDDLIENWRKITFRLPLPNITIDASTNHKQEGEIHHIISTKAEASRRHLSELGAQDIEETRMGIDEIAVEIIRGSKHVATYQS